MFTRLIQIGNTNLLTFVVLIRKRRRKRKDVARGLFDNGVVKDWRSVFRVKIGL